MKKIVSSNKLDKMDIIIGPMYSSLFQIICKRYGNDSRKTLVSPISRDNIIILDFPMVYKI